MRPTGVVLIALYHFVSAIFLVVLAIFLVVGGSVVGAMFGAGHGGAAGYGVWTFREWGRILCIVLAVISILLSLPGLLLMHLHFGFFFGGFRLFRIALNVLIIWYLAQPQIVALFHRSTPALPRA